MSSVAVPAGSITVARLVSNSMLPGVPSRRTILTHVIVNRSFVSFTSVPNGVTALPGRPSTGAPAIAPHHTPSRCLLGVWFHLAAGAATASAAKNTTGILSATMPIILIAPTLTVSPTHVVEEKVVGVNFCPVAAVGAASISAAKNTASVQASSAHTVVVVTLMPTISSPAPKAEERVDVQNFFHRRFAIPRAIPLATLPPDPIRGERVARRARNMSLAVGELVEPLLFCGVFAQLLVERFS